MADKQLIKQLSNRDKKIPKFIFFHMSATPNLYLEQPYIYNLEQKIAAKTLFVSEEAREMIEASHLLDGLKCPKEIFANPAPAEFANVAPARPDLKRILVVSNHIPQEVKEAQLLLLERGVDIELLGEKGEQYTRVTANLLNQYDAIISIGKTTQYCLVAGKPVYVYDKFGGYGYLNEENFDLAAKNNFSGRGGVSKTAQEITNELIAQYKQALRFSRDNIKRFQKTYLLPNVLPRVFCNLYTPHFSFDKKYSEYVMVAKKAMQEKIILDWKYLTLQEEHSSEHREHQKIIEHAKNLQDINGYLEFQLNNAIKFRGSRKIKHLINGPKRLANRANQHIINQKVKSKKRSLLRLAQQFGLHEYKFIDDQLFLIRDNFVKPTSEALTVLTRIRNEELLLPDTLQYLSKHSQCIFVYDDDSNDKTFELLCKEENVKLVIANLHWRSERIEEETRSRRVLLDEAKEYSNSQWFWYTDADERIISSSIQKYLKSVPESIDGIRMRLFDAYMTEDDQEEYRLGKPLKDFRHKFGPEYRDILTFFKNKDSITYQGLDAREPVGAKKVITHFYCQHYGKALSYRQWQETCKYYMNNFGEPYKTKWKNRLGKAVHKRSDWGGELYGWGDGLFQNGKKLS